MESKGSTILITIHQYDVVAELCDNFALLKTGEIVFNLTMTELIDKALTKYQNTEKPVKCYLENMMNDAVYNPLSWI